LGGAGDGEAAASAARRVEPEVDVKLINRSVV